MSIIRCNVNWKKILMISMLAFIIPLTLLASPPPSYIGGGNQPGMNLGAGTCEDPAFRGFSNYGDIPESLEARIVIGMNQAERELILIGIPLWLANLKEEVKGVTNPPNGELTGGPEFAERSFFLNYFVNVVAPDLYSRIYGAEFSEPNAPNSGATEEDLLNSIHIIELSSCDRTALSISLELWSNKAWGHTGQHTRLCGHSQIMAQSGACKSFQRWIKAYKSLRDKLETDQSKGELTLGKGNEVPTASYTSDSVAVTQ